MFRQIAAISLMLIFAANVFNRVAIVVDYYANTASFANKCENKARPMMHCNGKCQMMKKLQEEEKKEQRSPGGRSENKNEVISSKSFFAMPLLLSNVASLNKYFISNEGKECKMSLGVFHPPSV